MTEHSIPETREGFLPGPYLPHGLTYSCMCLHNLFFDCIIIRS